MKLLVKFAAVWYSRLYLLAFMVMAILALPDSTNLAGATLQQIFIAFLIFFRLRQRRQLFMIPDEILVCLPYFWALTNFGSANSWFAAWLPYFLAAFILSSLAMIGNRRWFSGGLRHNSLLQAIYCSLVFVLLFATILRSVFPPFTCDLYRDTLMNSLVFFAGIPICLVSVEPCRQT